VGNASRLAPARWPGNLTHVLISTVILDLFFVPGQLPLNLVNRQIDGRLQLGGRFTRYEIMFVFRRHEDFHRFAQIVAQVDRDVNDAEPIKIMHQFASLLLNDTVSGIT